MAVTLRWINRVIAEELRIYRDTAPMDPSSLPAPIDVLGGSERIYVDPTVVDGLTYYYRVGAVLTSLSPDKIAVSEEVEILASGSPSAPSFPAITYRGAVVSLTSSKTVTTSVAAASWDQVAQYGTTGAWSAGQPTRLVVPTGVTLINLRAHARFTRGSTGNLSMFASFQKNGNAATAFRPQLVSAHRRGNIAYTGQSLVLSLGPMVVTGGDYFEMAVQSNVTGSSLAVDGTTMEMEVLA